MTPSFKSLVEETNHLCHNEIMKEKLNILLVCGAGASSSFMAAKMRNAARDRGLNITVTARSESEVSNYANEVDAVMVGPHLEGDYASLKQTYGGKCAVILMDSDYYGKLDGNKRGPKLMLKPKCQYFGHLMQRTDSSEKSLILGKIEGGRRRG